MTTWRLLKRDDVDGKFWAEVGTHQSEHAWSLGYTAPTEIGAVHGAGEYLLIGPDERFKELTVAERREFYAVEEETPEEIPEPVSLKAAPSAADVMARDG